MTPRLTAISCKLRQGAELKVWNSTYDYSYHIVGAFNRTEMAAKFGFTFHDTMSPLSFVSIFENALGLIIYMGRVDVDE